MMQRGNSGDARAVSWDDDGEDWSRMEVGPEAMGEARPSSWVTRQLIAAIWILIAWAVGTLVFEMGAVS